MRRTCLAFLVSVSIGLPLGAQTAADQQAAVKYVQSAAIPSGGYAPAPSGKAGASLRATSSALRALKYSGGEPTNKAGDAKFISSCYDKATGGFADQPGGKPDVFTTAVGIMAAADLGILSDADQQAVLKYLGANVKSFEDIRIAVAGLERIGGKQPPQAAEWKALVLKMRNPDGTFGKDAGAARDTGSAVVALLRLGAPPENLEAVLKTLNAGQRKDGGFGKADAEGSDLETSYRVLRCFVMLKQKPKNAAALGAFVAKCRNADGGCGVAPGQPSSVSATYFAAILQHWLAN